MSGKYKREVDFEVNLHKFLLKILAFHDLLLTGKLIAIKITYEGVSNFYGTGCGK